MDLILKLVLDRWRFSRSKLFHIFTPFLEKDVIFLSSLEGSTKS